MKKSISQLLIIILLSVPFLVHAQSMIQEKESRLKKSDGFEKLELLYDLSGLYGKSNLRKAERYAKQANSQANALIGENIGALSDEEVILIMESKLRFGEIQYERKSYLSAKATFEESKLASEELIYPPGIRKSEKYLNSLDSLASLGQLNEGFFDKIDVGSAISNSTNSMATATELKMAQMSEKQGDTASAITHYEKAVKLMRTRGDFVKAKEIENKISMIKEKQRLDSLRQEIEAKPDSTTAIITENLNPDSLTQSPIVQLPESVIKQNQEEQEELTDLKTRAENLEEEGDYVASLETLKEYTELLKKWQKDSAAISMAEVEMDRLKRQNEIADLNILAIQQEKEAEVRLKNTLIVIAVLVGVSLIFILFLYITKRKKHQELEVAYTDLDEAKGQLEEAEQHISKLLEQQVSPEIAEALIEDKPQREKQYVAVMFLDIRGFTPIAEKMDPGQLIEYQNQVFGFMIEIIQKRHGNINQFMGDGFMSTFGAPVSHGNDIRNAFLAAQEILDQISQLNESGKIPHTTLGIGIHAGYVVTGNVGTDSRKQFSVTGNTVIVAARVEQLNKKYGSQLIITEDVYKSLEDSDINDKPDMIDVKVKGRSKPVKIVVLNKLEETV